MPEILILVGPPGSGKSTLSATFGHIRINQDEQGKDGHLTVFKTALEGNYDILIDRMNFSKEQRNRYIELAKKAGYKTKIIVLHESSDTCLNRMKSRKDHPTIKDDKTASKVLNFFFSKYERPSPDEANEIEFRYPEGDKPLAIICDLDGTLCQIDHRLHYVRGEGKKDWKGFFENLKNDTPNNWCADILNFYNNTGTEIILCSGRTDNYWQQTTNWLSKWGINYHQLFMRNRQDFRPDNIVKEIILEFEIKTRYTPYFFIDDRQQVVDMYRKHGYTVLQCAKGDF